MEAMDSPISTKLVFRSKDKEFTAHNSSFIEHSVGRLSNSPVLRHQHESPTDSVRRREKRRSINSSPLIITSTKSMENLSEIQDSSDYRESGLRKLKSTSWESIARWEKENEFLFALIEDESDWLTRLFPEEEVQPEYFFQSLEDGVLLCKLARLCQDYAVNYGRENKKKIPSFDVKIHARARCRGRIGQFMSRENVELFLKWCRVHKIPEPILFESNDVVEKTEEEGLREGAREIVLCLMEVARLGVKFGVAPPKLILLEKEIELEENLDQSFDGNNSPLSEDSGVDTAEIEYNRSHDQNRLDEQNDRSKNDSSETKNGNDASVEVEQEQARNDYTKTDGNRSKSGNDTTNISSDDTDNGLNSSRRSSSGGENDNNRMTPRKKSSTTINRRKSSSNLKSQLHDMVSSFIYIFTYLSCSAEMQPRFQGILSRLRCDILLLMLFIYV